LLRAGWTAPGAIARAGGCECTWQAEEQLDHVLDLRLLRAPVADDRALDLRGRVLEDGQARLDGREHRHATGVSELQRAADVDRVEQVLDGHAPRLALREEARQLAVNPMELVGE
jgi:hypothetical protein